VSTARETILARVRSATAGTPELPSVPRAYRRAGELTPAERLERLRERIGDYRAEVHVVAERDVQATVAAALRARNASRVGIPAGLPPEWHPDGVELVVDSGLSPAELDALDGVVTGCTLAIAETGTLILASGPAEGRRALTLVPDLHICVVREDQVVELVPEAFDGLSDLVGSERRPLTFVSGPSATSDIELSRVEGVHGPRTLIAVIALKEAE
jgi:L-lactate dehydrogenase complex protein LldG